MKRTFLFLLAAGLMIWGLSNSASAGHPWGWGGYGPPGNFQGYSYSIGYGGTSFSVYSQRFTPAYGPGFTYGRSFSGFNYGYVPGYSSFGRSYGFGGGSCNRRW